MAIKDELIIMLKHVLLFTSIFCFACTTSKFVDRAPSSEANEIIERVSKGQSPYEVLDVHPSASVIEIERTTNQILQSLSGWNLFDLTKYAKAEHNFDEVTQIIERDPQTYKKIIDSYLVLNRVHRQEGFKIGWGRFKFNLGKDDLTQIKSESFRDIKIWYEDELGQYQVRWGSLREVSPPSAKALVGETQGYIVEFKPKANRPDQQQRFEDIRKSIRSLSKERRNMAKILSLQDELSEISEGVKQAPLASKRSFELAQELDLRYQIKEPLPTHLLNQLIRVQGRAQSCHGLIGDILR